MNRSSTFLGILVFAFFATFSQAQKPAQTQNPGPVFYDDFEVALKESKATGKPLITIFSAKWCGPCQKMKKSVYPSAEVTPFHDKFIWAYLDTDLPKNKGLSKQFKVAGIPHIAFVSPTGELIESMRGSVPPATFAKTLTAVLAKVPPTTVTPGTTPVTTAPPVEEKKKGLFGNLFKKKSSQ
jgi:thioredoxin-related protein